MSNNKLPLNEFTESLAGILEYNHKNECTNEYEHKKLLKILTEVMSGELTKRQRDCIVMRYYRRLTVTQIACELGVGKSTVSRHITKAKSRLRKILKYYLVSR